MANFEFNYRYDGKEINYREMQEFLKFGENVDFSMLENAFEESTIYRADIEDGSQRSTTYVTKMDEHDESAG